MYVIYRLTAFCARVFHKTTFQDWEHYLYIDPSVITRAISWLLDYQTYEGSFYETSINPLDRKMNLTVRSFVTYYLINFKLKLNRNICSTLFIVIIIIVVVA